MLLANPFHSVRPWTPTEAWIILLLAGVFAGIILIVFLRCRTSSK